MVAAWGAVRAATACLIAVALIAQLIASAHAATERGWDVTVTVANFLSFFSVQSSILTMLTLAFGSVWLWSNRRDEREEPFTLGIALACVTTYVLWTGIFYNTLLRSPILPGGTRVPWSNEVIHIVIPVLLLADLLFAPRRRSLPWGTLAVIAVFPTAWAVYTMIRGPLTVNPRTDAPYWYPYTFFNPVVTPDGYIGVGERIAGFTILAMGIGALVIWWTRRLAARRTAGAGPPGQGPGIRPR